jgi:hypothetical protein
MITRRIYNFPAMGWKNPSEEMGRMPGQLQQYANIASPMLRRVFGIFTGCITSGESTAN